MVEVAHDRRNIPTVKLVTRAFMHDPYPALSAVREASPPAVPVVQNGWRQWIVTRYDDVRHVLGDRSFEREFVRRLEDRQVTMVRPEKYKGLPAGLRRGVIERDGSDHDRLQAVIKDSFRHDRIMGLRPRIEEVADNLLGELPVGEPIDLVERFTDPLAANIISELIGIPTGARLDFPVWWNSILCGGTKDEVENGGRLMDAFCRDMVAWRRADPANDTLTDLARAERDGEVDQDEATSTLANILIGGMEPGTVIANGVALLLTHRHQFAKLRADMRLLPNCVEEILRYECPFRLLGPRFASKELALDGVTIPAGDLIAVCVAAANRDPRRFPDPDTFDIARDRNPHLAFGYGMHHCIAAQLGRLEALVGLERFLRRFPNSKLAVSWNDLQWRAGALQRRLHSVPVVLNP